MSTFDFSLRKSASVFHLTRVGIAFNSIKACLAVGRCTEYG